MTVSKDAGGVMTLVDLLRWRAEVSGDHTAYSYNDEPRTFAELWSDVEVFAATLLAQGVRNGGRVVLALPNGHDFFTAFYGAQTAGAVAVPIFPGVPQARVVEVAGLCDARHVVVPSDTPHETLGEHTHEVLSSWLGKSLTEVDQLLAANVVLQDEWAERTTS